MTDKMAVLRNTPTAKSVAVGSNWQIVNDSTGVVMSALFTDVYMAWNDARSKLGI